MFGVELVAAALGLGAIALAYFVFNYSLREKTFEEALAEQREGSSDPGKNHKKDKSKKLKKKILQSSGNASDVSPHQVPVKTPFPADASTTKFAAVKLEGKKRQESESTSADEVSAKAGLVRKQKELSSQRPPRSSESETEKKSLPAPNHPKPKKDGEKKVLDDQVKAGRLAAKENREEVEVPKVAVEHTRKPNLVELEIARAGHPETLSKTVSKKEVKSEKLQKPLQAGALQKETTQKKPLAVVTTNAVRPLPVPLPYAARSDYGEVLGLLKTVQLTDAETQNLLQVLIVKQSERHSEWVQLGKGKPADPATIAKRLMEDKERELLDEKQMNRALIDQLRDMKNLLNQEKLRLREITDSNTQSTDKMSVFEQQLKSVNARLKESQDKHAIEVAHLTRRVQDAETRAANVIVVEEENRKLAAERLQQKTVVTNDTEAISKELDAVRSERDRLAEDLQSNQKRIQELQEQNKHQIQTETFVRSAEPDESRLQTLQLKLEEVGEKEKAASEGRDLLEKRLADLLTASSKKDAEIETLVRHLEDSQAGHSELKQANERLTQAVDALKESKKREQDSEEAHLRNEVQQLKDSVESSRKHEEELQNQIQQVKKDGFEEAKNYYEPQITETRDRHREVISRLFPSINLEKSLNSGEWLEELERAAESALHLDGSSSRQEVEQLHKLQAEVERYRAALTETEKKLVDLQNSVEFEEGKWELVGQSAKEHEDKWKNLQTQLSEVLDEKNNVQKLLEERSSSVGDVEHRLQEAEERIQAFSSVQEQLDSLRAEGDRLKGDLGETRRDKDHLSEEANTLRRTLAESSRIQAETEQRAASFLQELTDLKNKSDNLDNLHREAIDLRQALDVEKDNAKKMAQELLRSRSLIQVGLESLRKEEETVSKLREALESREHSLNGSMGGHGDRIGSSHVEVVRSDDRHQVFSAH